MDSKVLALVNSISGLLLNGWQLADFEANRPSVEVTEPMDETRKYVAGPNMTITIHFIRD